MPKVGLFVTCLVDLVRPQVGFAAVKLLEQAGCEVHVPASQTCCGQPAWNAGDNRNAAAIARNVVDAFEGFDYVVAPSGSCAGMLRRHYPEVLKDDPRYAARARALAERSHELMSFLVRVRGMKTVEARCARTVCYHDSCSSLREMGVRAEPRALLSSVEGLETRELTDPEICCGFGGLFSVKYPDISERMADDKLADAMATGASMLVGGDLGCLLHLAGRARRKGLALEVRHVAEILAGEAE
ncbi:MAG TPA: (Fe-S)-binding protein [Rhizomicrobium sp.]|jgi:L-lactate dehydrogenase complex protein LldE